MWLADSLAAADAVVKGTADSAAGTLEVDTLVCGTLAASLLHDRRVTIAGSRFSPAPGVWILARTTNGYWSTNPDKGPLPDAEWAALAATARPRDQPELVEHVEGATIYRTLKAGDGKTWHGPAVSTDPDELWVVLHDHGTVVVRRGFDHGELTTVRRLPDKGPGFWLEWSGGKVVEAYFTVDDEKHGLYRRYFRDTTSLAEERTYVHGVQDGHVRTFRDPGVIERDEVWKNGLPLPIVAYTGKAKSEAKLHRGAGVPRYVAPRELIERIKVGMTTAQVSALLKLDFSPSVGLRFVGWSCDEDWVVTFEHGRVIKATMRWNGVCCM